jgi:trehalose 6-phosphate synthase
VHEEIGEWAVTINPFDIYGQAQAIHEALQLPEEERRRRAEAIREHVRLHPVEAWIDAQLADLDRVGTTIGR